MDIAGNYRQFLYHEHEPDNSKNIEEVTDTGNHIRFVPRPMTTPPPAPYDLNKPATADRTVASAWLFDSHGGGVAYFGEVVVCENDKGRDLEKAFFQALGGGYSTLGSAWLGAQQKYWADNKDSGDVFRASRIYLSIMTFFGDPSLRLPTFA